MKHFGSADELRDYLADLNFGFVPRVGASGTAAVVVGGNLWLAYCTDPDGDWFFESGDPEERMVEDEEGWREYERIGFRTLAPLVDARGADLLWPVRTDRTPEEREALIRDVATALLDRIGAQRLSIDLVRGVVVEWERALEAETSTRQGPAPCTCGVAFGTAEGPCVSEPLPTDRGPDDV